MSEPKARELSEFGWLLLWRGLWAQQRHGQQTNSLSFDQQTRRQKREEIKQIKRLAGLLFNKTKEKQAAWNENKEWNDLLKWNWCAVDGLRPITHNIKQLNWPTLSLKQQTKLKQFFGFSSHSQELLIWCLLKKGEWFGARR